MSAIAGILFFDGAPVEPGLIETLTSAMERRGPDEQTHWVQGSVALGHCMLHTTPESLEEHQPLMSQDKNLVLVWDGRLDNREKLHRDLNAAGATLRDNSDAELALQCYAVWGEECPKRLLGDFAFAVWDARQGKLFCVRDQMGARPFYYTHNDRFFAFASEDETLLKLPGVSNKPNEERIAYFLMPSFRDFDHTRSWLEDVLVLLPAQIMTALDDGTVQKNIYWKLEPGEENVYATDEECQAAFMEVFAEAVRCRMRILGDVSAMMSGGLDSASIAAMVKRRLDEIPGKQFHTYSAISDHPESCVESQCIQSLTKDLGGNAHFVSVPSFTGMVSVQDLIEAAWSRAHPVDNSILLPAMMCLAASRDGHRVMLHGASGDLTTDVPNQYPAYLLAKGQWRKAWMECRAASCNNNYLRGTSPFRLLLLSIGTIYAPRKVKLLVRWLRRKRTDLFFGQDLINPEFANRLNLVERIKESERNLEAPFMNIQQVHIRTLQPPHGIVAGLIAYDRVAGRYGMELRDPWSDRRVVEFWLRLPLKYKVRDGWTKYLVRKAFAKDIAEGVRWRVGKEHLGWHFAARLMDATPSLASTALGQDLAVLDGHINMKTVRERYVKYRVSEKGRGYQSIYDMMSLIFWVKRISC